MACLWSPPVNRHREFCGVVLFTSTLLETRVLKPPVYSFPVLWPLCTVLLCLC